jgi:hypothetical protein
MHTEFELDNQKEKGHLGDLGIVWQMTLNWILQKRCEGVDLIQLAQDGVQ